MKKTLALLLVAIMAITCTLAALSVSAEEPVYTDKVNLLPASEDAIRINGGVPTYTLDGGKLSLTRSEESTIAWPSIVYDVNAELDLSKTPYLHLNFETSGVGDRGVNGHIYLKDANGDQVGLQISAMGGNGIDDFRDTDELYIKIDLEKFVKEHIEAMRDSDPEYDVTFDTSATTYTITYIDLSVYGGIGETIVWNTLALATDAAGGEEDNSSEAPAETSSETPAETSSEAPADNSSEAPAETSSTPAESSDKVPTGDTGVILFAVLAVVALAGVAVVVKVRH